MGQNMSYGSWLHLDLRAGGGGGHVFSSPEPKADGWVVS